VSKILGRCCSLLYFFRQDSKFVRQKTYFFTATSKVLGLLIALLLVTPLNSVYDWFVATTSHKEVVFLRMPLEIFGSFQESWKNANARYFVVAFHLIPFLER